MAQQQTNDGKVSESEQKEEEEKPSFLAPFMKQHRLTSLSEYEGFHSAIKKSHPTRPSTECFAVDAMCRKFVKAPCPINSASTVQEVRDWVPATRKANMATRTKRGGSVGALAAFVPDPERLTISESSVKNMGPLYAHLMTYPGASLKKGVILYLHGGGFFQGFPEMGYPMLQIMSQHTGMAALGLQPHLCPEISLPQMVDECVECYRYIGDTLKVPAAKIFVIGDSAGGGLVLLTLQKLTALGIAQPRGAITLSPYLVDATLAAGLKAEREGIDDCIIKQICPAWNDLLIDDADRKEWDACADDTARNEVISQARYCSMNGEWKGMCPLYVSASLNELLINDARIVVEKAKGFGVDVEYRFAPYLPHTTALMVELIPEARDELVLIVAWMQKQMLKQHKQ